MTYTLWELDALAGLSRWTSRDISVTRKALPELVDRVRELEAALERCEVVMDTAALHDLPQQLPPAYRDSWVAAHLAAREALAKGAKP